MSKNQKQIFNIVTEQKTFVQESHITKLAICGVFIALVYVATAFINIRLPIIANGGLIHLGNVPLFIGAAFFGKKLGAAAGGIGMALFDVLSGWFLWAPFTFIIVSLMGWLYGSIVSTKKITFIRILLASIVVLFIKVIGYYIAEGFIYGNWISPVASIPGNIVQILMATIISIPIILGLATQSDTWRLT